MAAIVPNPHALENWMTRIKAQSLFALLLLFFTSPTFPARAWRVNSTAIHAQWLHPDIPGEEFGNWPGQVALTSPHEPDRAIPCIICNTNLSQRFRWLARKSRTRRVRGPGPAGLALPIRIGGGVPVVRS